MQEEGRQEKERTWKPTAAGVLCIIAGVTIIVVAGQLFAINCDGSQPLDAYTGLAFILLLLPWSMLLIIGGTVGIVGGIYALRRKNWGLALAGSILTLLSSVVVGIHGIIYFDSATPFVVYGIAGILAIIFVVLGKGEFRAKALVAYQRGDADDEGGNVTKPQ